MGSRSSAVAAGIFEEGTMNALIAAAALLAALCSIEVRAQTAVPGTDRSAADLAASNRTFQIEYFTNADRINLSDSQLSVGLFLSEDRDLLGSIGLLIPTDLFPDGPLSVQVGPRLYGALLKDQNEDLAAAAIGIQARYDMWRAHELAIVGSAYYAPDILTFGAADSIRDLSARAELRVAENVIGFGGWRWLYINKPGSNRTLQDQLMAGIRWMF
jgi:hypothetical protein